MIGFCWLHSTVKYPCFVGQCRQNGIGYTSFIARMGVAIAPLIILLEDVWKLLPDVVFCPVAIVAGLVACLLPETRDVCLPEFIEDIEETRYYTSKINRVWLCRKFLLCISVVSMWCWKWFICIFSDWPNNRSSQAPQILLAPSEPNQMEGFTLECFSNKVTALSFSTDK